LVTSEMLDSEGPCQRRGAPCVPCAPCVTAATSVAAGAPYGGIQGQSVEGEGLTRGVVADCRNTGTPDAAATRGNLSLGSSLPCRVGALNSPFGRGRPWCLPALLV
jgi:hypothetical protein